MTTILFVKTSSLGDVVHNCPAVSEVARALPGASIDWLVEEPFAGIARMQRAVRRVIPVAVRRWRTSFWQPAVWSEIGALRRALHAERYDAVLDTQSLLKSALLAAQLAPPRADLRPGRRLPQRRAPAPHRHRDHAPHRGVHGRDAGERLLHHPVDRRAGQGPGNIAHCGTVMHYVAKRGGLDE